ncbi:cysteine--tRNA ligase [Tumebacillus permanentifrigoris]|uniref:Cysteine--tRNA ligase n=1 Tax=Tumebacillus permanentifrigoris TaxID=378543 RepID=A0A316D5I6_9BACL|nr:cysteine--tRNA ligase [Tumebacillus permanentifrigoris]PWK05654.1 cysteinyl-tRNA synthetase [Tumebacillus permanentifrigoris]
MSIQVYNTLTRQKEPFVPLEDHKVKMYVCGPTVYNYFHIGNARPFVVFDQVRRYLQYRGYEVKYVMNFTDVDDKIIKRGLEEGISPQQVADKYVEAFFTDVEALHVERADVYPRVTEEMQEIIAMIEELISTGHAYASEGDVYFSAHSFDEYGKLSKQTLENLIAGARVEVSEKKQNQVDFALWKAAKPGEIAWSAPWGEGRPGWHIECSAMIRKHLGEQIDIHGGGVDLTFPHHENEIAQSEACTHKPLAKYWMHNEFLNLNHEKMSKSTGNFLTTRGLLEQYEGAALRFLLLSAHYRNPVNFSPDLVENAKNGLDRIRSSYANLQHRLETAVGGDAEKVEVETFRAQFIAAMDEDFNTADAITAIFELASDANKYLRQERVQRHALEAYVALFEELMGVLALPLVAEQADLDAEIEALIAERTEARNTKNWARADEIRDQFNAMGIVLEDTPQGIRWRRK